MRGFSLSITALVALLLAAAAGCSGSTDAARIHPPKGFQVVRGEPRPTRESGLPPEHPTTPYRAAVRLTHFDSDGSAYDVGSLAPEEFELRISGDRMMERTGQTTIVYDPYTGQRIRFDPGDPDREAYIEPWTVEPTEFWIRGRSALAAMYPEWPTPEMRGQDTVAGHRCTVLRYGIWQYGDPPGFGLTACVSDQGVVLRLRSVERHRIPYEFEVMSLDPGAQDESTFSVPDGFKKFAAPPPVADRPGGPTDDFPALSPWPPPEPSARYILPRERLLAAIPACREIGAPTLTRLSLIDVGNCISRALDSAGYSERSYYAAPGGFALVARLERFLVDDGRPAAESVRFLDPESEDPFSLTNYVAQLFFAPEGFYRQIVFVVVDQPMVATSRPLSPARAHQLLSDGADRLPIEYAGRPFSPEHQVSVLVYEFSKRAGKGNVRPLRPGRLSGQVHLVQSGIGARLGL